MKQTVAGPQTMPGTAPARFQQIKAEVHRQIVAVIDVSGLTHWSNERLRREVEALANKLVRDVPDKLQKHEREALVEQVQAEVFGLGPLEQFMNDPTISDILVNGPKNVYVERLGRLEPTGVVFNDNAHLTQIIQRITARVGRRIDEASPMVDARLPDGSRVNAILPPLALEGAMLSIRRFGVRSDRLPVAGKRHAHGGHAATSGGRGPGAHQHPDLRRHGGRQDHVAQRPVPAHPAR